MDFPHFCIIIMLCQHSVWCHIMCRDNNLLGLVVIVTLFKLNIPHKRGHVRAKL